MNYPNYPSNSRRASAGEDTNYAYHQQNQFSNAQFYGQQQQQQPALQSWSQPQPLPPQQQQQQNPQNQQLSQSQSNQMLAMMMWQQMQPQGQFMPGYMPNQLQQVPPPLRSTHGQPFTQENQCDYDLAQVIYESELKELSQLTAIESLHYHRGHHADAWKNYYLLHARRIQTLVGALHSRHSRQAPEPPQVIPNNDRASSSSTLIDPRKTNDPPPHKLQPPRRSSDVPPSQATKPTQNRANGTNSAKVKVEPRSPPTSNAKLPQSRRRVSQPSTSRIVAAVAASSRRKTLNSLCTPTLNALPPDVPIDKSTGLPVAPSRSPSPPAIVERKAKGSGTAYTKEDESYFFRFIAYELKRDPGLKKSELCDMLGEKVPAHSALSWSAFWRKHEDIADKVLFNAQLDETDEHIVLVNPSPTTPRRARERAEQLTRKHAKKDCANSDSETNEEDSGDDDDDEDAEGSTLSESSGDEASDGSYEDDDKSDNLESTDDEDGGEMGEAGAPFGMPERRAIAKHIASVSDWKSLKGVDKWAAFTEKYPQRSQASWKEYYRRKEEEIDVLARRYKKRNIKRKSIDTQRGRPSWASGRGASDLGRKRERRGDDGVINEPKRQRTADTT